MPLLDVETAPDEYCFDIREIDIAREQQACSEIGPWYRYIKTGIMPHDAKFTKADFANTDQYAMKSDILIHLFQPRMKNKYKYDPLITQIVVSQKFRAQILNHYHETLAGAGCHSGFDRLFQSVRQKYYWKRMYTDIQEYQQTCVKYQQASHYHPPKPTLSPLPVSK